MTDHRQGQGRANEAEFRSKGPPRIPRIPPEDSRQMPFTLVAVLLMLLMLIAWLIIGF